MGNSIDTWEGCHFVPDVSSPSVRRRELGHALRALRLEQGLTVEQAAEQLMCSMTKLKRIEYGQRGVTRRDIRDLCNLYGVTDSAERDRLTELAQEGRQRGWWHAYDLNFETFVGLEAEATGVGCYQPEMIWRVIQNANYARVSCKAVIAEFTQEGIEGFIIRVHSASQRHPRNPLSPMTILDGAALNLVAGRGSATRAQLAKMLGMLKLPALRNVPIQVPPLELGSRSVLESDFTILELPGLAPGVVYVEGVRESTYLERAEDLERYCEIFDGLESLAELR